MTAAMTGEHALHLLAKMIEVLGAAALAFIVVMASLILYVWLRNKKERKGK